MLQIANAFAAARRHRAPADPNLVDVSETARPIGIARRTLMTRDLHDRLKPDDGAPEGTYAANVRQCLRVAQFALRRAKGAGREEVGDAFTTIAYRGNKKLDEVPGWVRIDERSGAALVSVRGVRHG